MNYKKVYRKLINKWKHKKVPEGLYTEKHHIIPKCLGGTDDPSNIVRLPAREHLVAHELLAMQYPNNLDINYAVISMSMSSKFTPERKGVKTSSRIFAAVRERCSILQKGKWMTKQHRQNLSKEKPKLQGRKVSDETSEKISKAKKGKGYGTAVIDTNTGQIFRTLREAGEFYGYHPETIRYWANRIPERGIKFYTGEDLGPVKREYVHKNNPVKVKGPDGTIYDSLKICAMRTKHNVRTIKNWIENDSTKGFSYVENKNND